MRRVILVSFLLLMGVSYALILRAAPGQNTIGYQGFLTDSAGQPIHGQVDITFALYDVQTGGTPLWTETHPGVTVDHGLFSVRLGEGTTLDPQLFSGPDRFLGIKAGADPEMTPRLRLSSVAYAFNALRVGGKKVSTGTSVLNPSAANSVTVHVNFPEPFQAPPAVIVSPPSGLLGGEAFIATEVAVTAAGCDITFRSISTNHASGTASFHWIAVGE